MRAARINRYLMCPTCKGDLGWINRRSLCCKSCQDIYPISGDIPIFSSANGSQRSRNDQLEQLKSELRQFWDTSQAYYEIAQAASQEENFNNNRGLVTMSTYCQSATLILECGCGEGTKLAQMSHEDAIMIGVDISTAALQQGAKKHRDVNFIQADIEEMPFKDNSFDCVYSAYTLEHVAFPEKAVEEMIRVTRVGGKIMFIAPNFGSPYFPSPCSTEDPEQRFRRRLRLTHRWLLRHPQDLEWEIVDPVALKANEYQIDGDTIREPYIHTLLKFLHRRNIRILKYSSMWRGSDKPEAGLLEFLAEGKAHLMAGRKGLYILLGKLALPPYKYYGSTLFIVGEKKNPANITGN